MGHEITLCRYLKVLVECVFRGLNDESLQVRNAALFAVGLFSEHLQVFVSRVHSSSITAVSERAAGGSFLGWSCVDVDVSFDFARFQPHIGKYSGELLPLLFNYMSKAEATGDKDPKGLVNSYYALEMFCENLGKFEKKYFRQVFVAASMSCFQLQSREKILRCFC